MNQSNPEKLAEQLRNMSDDSIVKQDLGISLNVTVELVKSIRQISDNDSQKDSSLQEKINKLPKPDDMEATLRAMSE